jgi:hypothetical protein
MIEFLNITLTKSGLMSDGGGLSLHRMGAMKRWINVEESTS